MGKVVATILALFMLVGCGAEASYEKKMNKILDEVWVDLEKMSYAMETVSVNYKDLQFPATRFETNIKKHREAVEKLTPPKSYKEDHENILAMLDAYIEVAKAMARFSEVGNKGLLETAMRYTKTASQYYKLTSFYNGE